eukprot:m51a1_g12753 hypothetical protein (158) ;mRNA; f:197-717
MIQLIDGRAVVVAVFPALRVVWLHMEATAESDRELERLHRQRPELRVIVSEVGGLGWVDWTDRCRAAGAPLALGAQLEEDYDGGGLQYARYYGYQYHWDEDEAGASEYDDDDDGDLDYYEHAHGGFDYDDDGFDDYNDDDEESGDEDDDAGYTSGSS